MAQTSQHTSVGGNQPIPVDGCLHLIPNCAISRKHTSLIKDPFIECTLYPCIFVMIGKFGFCTTAANFGFVVLRKYCTHRNELDHLMRSKVQQSVSNVLISLHYVIAVVKVSLTFRGQSVLLVYRVSNLDLFVVHCVVQIRWLIILACVLRDHRSHKFSNTSWGCTHSADVGCFFLWWEVEQKVQGDGKRRDAGIVEHSATYK